MAGALEIILAELSIDSPEKDVKKIDKVLSKLKKNIKGTEKETKKLSKTFKQIKSPGLQRVGRGFQRAGRGFQRAGRVGRRVGGALTGGFGGIPIIGGAIAAALGAMAATRGRFIAGVSLKRELVELANNFKSAFGRKARDILAFVEEEGSFFRKDDFRAGFTALRDAGVDPKSIKKNVLDITRFAKAQGFTTVTEAVQALTAGRIKAGRGLDVTQIKQLEALAPFTQDVASADIAFQRIVEILKTAAPQLEKFAKKTTDATKGFVKQSNTVRTMTETTTLLGRVTKNTAGEFISLQPVFEATERSVRVANRATANLAEATSGIVSSLISSVPDIIEGIKGTFETAGELVTNILDFLIPSRRQAVRELEQIRVNEAIEQSLETPREQIRLPGNLENIVIPNPRSPRRTSSINININVSGTSTDTGIAIAKEVRKTLNLLSRTSFRHNTGLGLVG